METKDDQLFSKEIPLLSAASELCYHTVHCSALNAEELRREEGIEALLEAYSRCVSIMGADSQPEQLHYRVISNITRCFEVACYFENCKKKILELPQLIVDVCRVVYFKHAPSVCLVTGLAANNTDLQNRLACNGILWSLLLFMFEYDYTLDEGGVEASENTNQQQAANNLARLAVAACCALSGYTLNFVDDPRPVHAIPPSQTSTADNSPHSASLSVRSNSLPNSTGYCERATNIIQQNQNLIQTVNTMEKIGDDKNEEKDNSCNAASENIIKESSKYRITGNASNRVVKHILDRLLTQFISNRLTTDADNQILKTLTSNTKNPYLIWDNGTRAQLLDFLDTQKQISARQQYEDVTDVLKVCSEFNFDSHQNELQIGGVYVRIYNEMPTFPIQDPKSFVLDLLDFLRQGYEFLTNGKSMSKANIGIGHKNDLLIPTLAPNHPNKRQTINEGLLSEYARSKLKNQLERQDTTPKVIYNFQENPNTITSMIMVLKALIAVINANPNLEVQCIGQFELLFILLSQNISEYDSIVKRLALEVISLVSRNKDCVSEISSCDLLGYYLTSLKDMDLKDVQQKVLDTLSGLVNVQKMVKEAHSKGKEIIFFFFCVLSYFDFFFKSTGAVIYILDQFCNSNNPQTRETCAELLGKMTSDKLSGPKIRISVCKFLPSVFLDAMIESPSASVQMFESTHEHPELIWNDKTRDSVCSAVHTHTENFYIQQKQNPKIQWHDPEILQEILSEDLIVSGVYLRLFVSNPGWTLRKPKQFLSDLLDFIVENMSRPGIDKNAIDLSTNSLVLLLNVQPVLADAVPVLGHIPKIFRQLPIQPKSALDVLHALALSEVC